jgi:hypothetical protein
VSAPSGQVAWVPVANQVVASVPVAAGGHYVLDSYVLADNNDSMGLLTSCFLTLGGTNVALSSVILPANGAGDQHSFALTGAGTVTDNGTAELRCTPQSEDGTWDYGVLTAIKVGSLN